MEEPEELETPSVVVQIENRTGHHLSLVSGQFIAGHWCGPPPEWCEKRVLRLEIAVDRQIDDEKIISSMVFDREDDAGVLSMEIRLETGDLNFKAAWEPKVDDLTKVEYATSYGNGVHLINLLLFMDDGTTEPADTQMLLDSMVTDQLVTDLGALQQKRNAARGKLIQDWTKWLALPYKQSFRLLEESHRRDLLHCFSVIIAAEQARAFKDVYSGDDFDDCDIAMIKSLDIWGKTIGTAFALLLDIDADAHFHAVSWYDLSEEKPEPFRGYHRSFTSSNRRSSRKSERTYDRCQTNLESIVFTPGSSKYVNVLDSEEYIQLAMKDIEMIKQMLGDDVLIAVRDIYTMCVISSGQFDARSRSALLKMAVLVGLPTPIMELWERQIGQELHAALESKAVAKKGKTRTLKIAAATVGGGALLALTGGLAAPAIAAGLPVLGNAIAGLGAAIGLGGAAAAAAGGIGAVGAMLASVGTAGAVVIFGATGMGLTGFKMSKRWGQLQEFDFKAVEGTSRDNLQLSVCVPGWLRSDVPEDPGAQFEELAKEDQVMRFHEVNSLVWETEVLHELGSVLTRMLTQKIAEQAASLWIQTTLTATAGVLTWPFWVISSLTSLDNTWMVAKDRASQAGDLLARAIADKAVVGQRPVSLVGYAVGARVIFYCLQSLWKMGEFNAVDSVVLLGAPVGTFRNDKRWRRARSVVSGRFVNGYTKNDWILGFLYRYLEWGASVAGLSPVGLPGIEDRDISEVITSHTDYASRLDTILTLIDFAGEGVVVDMDAKMERVTRDSKITGSPIDESQYVIPDLKDIGVPVDTKSSQQQPFDSPVEESNDYTFGLLDSLSPDNLWNLVPYVFAQPLEMGSSQSDGSDSNVQEVTTSLEATEEGVIRSARVLSMNSDLEITSITHLQPVPESSDAERENSLSSLSEQGAGTADTEPPPEVSDKQSVDCSSAQDAASSDDVGVEPNQTRPRVFCTDQVDTKKDESVKSSSSNADETASEPADQDAHADVAEAHASEGGKFQQEYGLPEGGKFQQEYGLAEGGDFQQEYGLAEGDYVPRDPSTNPSRFNQEDQGCSQSDASAEEGDESNDSSPEDAAMQTGNVPVAPSTEDAVTLDAADSVPTNAVDSTGEPSTDDCTVDVDDCNPPDDEPTHDPASPSASPIPSDGGQIHNK